jgi:hypothetical protein
MMAILFIQKDTIMKSLITLLLSVLCISMLEASQAAQELSWRALAMIPSQLHTSPHWTMGWLASLGFRSGSLVKSDIPAYDQRAPAKIFAVDYREGKLIVHNLSFTVPELIRADKGESSYPQRLDSILDAELVAKVAAATGVAHPHCWYCCEISPEDVHAVFVDWFKEIVGVQGILTYKLSYDPEVMQALARPFFFVSSRVSDEMLIHAFQRITWNEIFEKLGKLKDGSIEHDGDQVATCRKGFDNWHFQAQKALDIARQENQGDLVLCIG